VRRQKRVTALEAAPKYIGRHQSGRHDLGGTHGRAGILDKIGGFQKLITQTVNPDNTFLHGYSCYNSSSLGTQNCTGAIAVR
jgi:hypothetical protein